VSAARPATFELPRLQISSMQHHPLSRFFEQDFIDDSLIAHTSLPGFFARPSQNFRMEPNRRGQIFFLIGFRGPAVTFLSDESSVTMKQHKDLV
jgi:hypothetical protein